MRTSVIILAAGKGSRMKSDLPKVLQPIGGQPMLHHLVRATKKIQPKESIIVHGHKGDAVKKAMDCHNHLKWVEQREQLGTGDAVKYALPHINTDLKGVCLVLVGDIPLIRPSTLQALAEVSGGDRLAVLTVKAKDPKGYGRIVKNKEGLITAIVEEKDATEEQKKITEVNTGVLAIPTQDLKHWLSKLDNNNAQEEYYLTDLVEIANHERRRVVSFCIKDEKEVAGINDKKQLSEIEREFQYRKASKLLNEGVTIVDAHRLDIRGQVSVGRDVYLDINTVLKGNVKIGNNVHIEPNCIIENTVIGDNVIIKANSMIEQSKIAANSQIGPFARLRPETVLEEGSKIGNFVEVKKSTIGRESKVNHLSYIGDARIGGNVNVGAGTITCNYDGVNKSPTIIDDHAFIGSNSSLVAPVTIGSKATVGAGSVVTKDVPQDSLTLTRAKQTSIDNWQRPTNKGD